MIAQSPEHVLASSQLHHVYATPSRVQTPDALITTEDVFEPRLNQYTNSRPSRSKSRNSLVAGHPYQTNVSIFIHSFIHSFIYEKKAN